MNLILKNLRLSYPNLFVPKSGPEEGSEPAYSASFLMNKTANAAEIKAMRDGILAVAREQWGADNVKFNEQGQLLVRKPGTNSAAPVKICLRDGSEKGETDGYGSEVMFFSARATIQPPCVDRNPAIILTKTSGKPYAGCYVNVAIRLWAMDNKFGKRVNAQLKTVQFAADGEAFGDAPVDPASVFENIGGESTDATDTTGAPAQHSTTEDPRW